MVLIIDRELSLMNCLQQVFPNSTLLLCRWHIEKNLVKVLKGSFEKGTDWEVFLLDWNSLISSHSEECYSLKDFLSKYSKYSYKTAGNQSRSIISYISETWLPFTRKCF
jgi:hypothetical protein